VTASGTDASWSRAGRAAAALVLAGALVAGHVASSSAESNGSASVASGTHGMVVAAQREASAVGRRILEAGGNAVDAAVAVGYALAVVDPCCGNIGGGGFMLVRRADGARTVIDFRETAPRAAAPDMYLGADGKPVPDASRFGWRAVAVPGTVLGLDRALSEYGRLGRTAVMAPAIGLARDGFVVDATDAGDLAEHAKRLAGDPEAARIFLRPDGTPYREGDRFVQPDLAATLALIAEKGADVLYRGLIAEAVATASAAHGGVLTARDFADYSVREAAPTACRYRGLHVFSAPLPSSGGTILCEMLNVLSGWDLKASGYATPRTLHLLAETMRHAYVDRNALLGDPAFVPDRSARLLSADYAAAIGAAIDPERATPSSAFGAGTPPHEGAETTHYSVVDGAGNAVAVTYTLNGNFGAGVVAPGTGFLLNDEMDDFATAPGAPNMFGLVQGKANAIAPGKRPLSSMTPTIVENDGKPVLVLGSPGGPRITTAVLQVLSDIVDFGLAPADAVAAARFHHQFLPDTLFYEKGGLPPATIEALTAAGYRLAERPPWGAVELIAIAPDGTLTGVNDPRRPAGAADGY
jgi:gamma-glutamyltranspeptidase/glutathione hydrolase